MLRWGVKEYGKFLPGWLILWLILCLVCYSCKNDSTGTPAEEQAYIADYEAPRHKWGFIDTTGAIRIAPAFDDVGSFREGMAAFNQGGKWGYMDSDGRPVIEATYKEAWGFSNHIARVTPFEGPSHFIRRDGTILKSNIADAWSAADDFSDGRAKVSVGSTFGYMDTSGIIVIQAVYSRAWNFEAGLAKVEFDGKLGVIDLRGNLIVHGSYDLLRICRHENQILARSHTVSILFDLSGQKIFELRDGEIMDTDGRYVAVKRNGEWAPVIWQGSPAIEITAYRHLMYLGLNRWAAKKYDGYTLLDENMNPLSPGGYEQINRFADGFAVYSKNGFWGYLDIMGQEVIGHPFGLAWDFKNGFARAAFREGIGFINRDLQLAFYPPPGTLDMRDFSEGLAAVQIAR